MNAEQRRIWVRQSRSDGKATIFMEPEYHEGARQFVLQGMANGVLNYLFECGHPSTELDAIGPSLIETLTAWWDEGNEFLDRTAPFETPAGVTIERMFWLPAPFTEERGEPCPDEN